MKVFDESQNGSAPAFSATAKNRGGFTLVELLMVIGIIAALIAMLLPVLNRARYQAKVVMCQSNLRQYGEVMMLYAAQSRGVIPLFYSTWIGSSVSNRSSQPVCAQYTSYATPLPTDKYSNLMPAGRMLFLSGIIRNPSFKFLYCPLQTNTRFAFGSDTQQFKFLGYQVRPESNVSPLFDGTGVYMVNFGFSNHYAGPGGTVVQSAQPDWPKAHRYGSQQAIAADCLPVRTSGATWPLIEQGHLLKGCNVLYGDGSVQWILAAAYTADYYAAPNKDGTTSDIATWNDWNTKARLVSGFWFDFDQQR